ncbi:FecR family protein [Chitinophaga sp. CF418]|uniref:FecR family protein n=1 Tax=Chitinophaga sp. CF418 TaxID=1855287 RepID=UPI00092143B5|nr:FecR domain-containing protein [Chitinophaga sp. CF418]SHN45438.1 FecR family protein [Chitinophaga sp. CF418]
MKPYTYLKTLFQKYNSGNIRQHELEELLSYFDTEDNHPIPGRLIHEALNDEHPDEADPHMEELLQQVKLNLRRKIVPPKRKLRLWYPAAIAASMLIAIGSLVYLTRYPATYSSDNKVTAADIMPGGNKATLTLANGTVIDLSKVNDGTLYQDQDVHIEKNQRGMISYVQDSSGSARQTLAFNIIHTPNGGRFQVILPDGTKVWLNAASTLKYPQRFNANTRTVELTGEAYFQVTPNKTKPFIVKSSDQEIKVLGTQFNLNAYMDSPFTFTTLQEGSLLVTNIKTKTSLKIAPGQQAVSGQDKLESLNVDASAFSSWRDGIILLNNATLDMAIPQIERWYDVEFVIEPGLSKVKLSGELPINTRLTELLAALSTHTGITFRLEGRRIMAKK